MVRWWKGLACAVLVSALPACGKPAPTFPAFSGPKEGLARAECRVLARVFHELLVSRKQGNVVLSPHALVLGLFDVAARGDENQRAQVLAFLGYSTWRDLEWDIHSASRVSFEGTAADEMAGTNRFQFETVVRRLGDDATAPTLTEAEPLHSAFNQWELERARRERPRAHFIALMDAQVAGVPMLTRPLFHPAMLAFGERESVAGVHMAGGAWYGVSPDFQSAFWAAQTDEGSVPALLESGAVVTFSLPTSPDSAAVESLPVLPCSGGELPKGGRSVRLDFRAPTFCARTDTALSTLAPDLRAQLATDVELRARLAFDERGTINLPPRAVRSPSLLDQALGHRTAHELHLTRPFFVTVHDRGSGAIHYVAYVGEPNSVSSCK